LTGEEMTIRLDFNDLIEYTDWERSVWHEWLRKHGDQALTISAGPHGDGRFENVGDLVKHIFSAEKRYVDRLSERPLTDTGSLPNNNTEALFEFGRQSRKDLKALLDTFPGERWDEPVEFKIVNNVILATPKKIIVHVLMHEIRHWAQIATIFRLNGLVCGFRDFLFSPAMGGEFRWEAKA
jgi:uncharacterized damage-inducible protein DinB